MEYQAGGEQASDSIGPLVASAPDLGAQAGVIFLSGAGQSGLSQDNEPILYIGPNRTSAIDDIRSVLLYIFIIAIFFTFFLILPGIRSDKFPTFICITTSLVVTSVVLIALFGTTWHVGEAPISAAYKAFSRDRIQGELSVRIGFQSVNITLIAHKYYILQTQASDQEEGGEGEHKGETATVIVSDSQSGDDKVGDDGSEVRERVAAATTEAATEVSASRFDVEVVDEEEEEEFEDDRVKGEADSRPPPPTQSSPPPPIAFNVSEKPGQEQDNSNNSSTNGTVATSSSSKPKVSLKRHANRQLVSSIASHHQKRRQAKKRSTFDAKPAAEAATPPQSARDATNAGAATTAAGSEQQYKSIKRVNLDINYNERFYWIEPNQMRQEYRHALERGLPYPILTVVEYLSQDEAGFSWSRQYRAAGYYSSIILWLSVCMCILMFCLHCAAPKYGVYAMQALGCLLLFTNLIYALLVPRGDQKLVIPFEGQSLTFRFGWNFWLVLMGGCLSTLVGTVIVIIDNVYPNYIFTTVLDVDFDSTHCVRYKKNRIVSRSSLDCNSDSAASIVDNKHKDSNNTDDGMKQPKQRPEAPAYLQPSCRQLKSHGTTTPLPSRPGTDAYHLANNNKDATASSGQLQRRRVEVRM